MSFMVTCPNCGPRSVYEYRYGGEQREQPSSDVPADVWAHYFYARRNEAGEQRELWNHRQGCGRWFLAVRDTRTNSVVKTAWP